MSTASIEDLIGQAFGVEDVELPGLGKTVKVRPLTRAEALKIQGVELQVDEMERRLLVMAMVEPKLTEDQIRQWQDVAPAGQFEPVTDAIGRLSGMTANAGKQAYADFRGEPGS